MKKFRDDRAIDAAFFGSLFPDSICQPREIRLLCNSSPVAFEEITQGPAKIIPLGSSHNRICIGRNLWDMETLRHTDLQDPLTTFSLVVPAFMTALTGSRKNGKGKGPRTDANTGEPYAVVVSAPQLSLPKQLKILCELMESARLAVVVWVGESYLEGWFSTRSVRGGRLAFCERAIGLGANRDMKARSNPYSLPGGVDQETGRLHAVVYLDPDALAEMHQEATKPTAVDRPKAVEKSKNRRGRSNGSRGKQRSSK